MGKFTGTFRAAPWLPENAIDLLDQLIQPGWKIIETGSGASTIWLAGRALSVLSFEHQPAWAEVVAKKLFEIIGGDPLYKIILSDKYPAEGVERGIQNSKQIKPPFDLALIDGRGRVRSIETAMPYIRPGGWIVLDNANRPRYEKAHKILAAAGWKTTALQGLIMPEKKRGFTQFWRKPLEAASKQPKKMRIRISEPKTDAGAKQKP